MHTGSTLVREETRDQSQDERLLRYAAPSPLPPTCQFPAVDTETFAKLQNLTRGLGLRYPNAKIQAWDFIQSLDTFVQNAVVPIPQVGGQGGGGTGGKATMMDMRKLDIMVLVLASTVDLWERMQGGGG